MAEKTKNVRVIITLNERTRLMVEEIEAATGSVSRNAAINFAIFEAHRSLFPAYLTNKSTKTKESVKEQKEREQIAICDALDGRVENGKCYYYTYNYGKRYEQSATLSLLMPNMVEGQYTPSKKMVEKLKAEGKAEYCKAEY